MNQNCRRILTVPVTDAQLSALECCGLFEEPCGSDENVLRLSLQPEQRRLVVSVNTHETIKRCLNDLSNGADESSRENGDKLEARASRALSNLYTKVCGLRFARLCPSCGSELQVLDGEHEGYEIGKDGKPIPGAVYVCNNCEHCENEAGR